ncbi:MAG: JDVT-CTERM system glutamic-type intramembrane protease [Burkholderiales bacterium]
MDFLNHAAPLGNTAASVDTLTLLLLAPILEELIFRCGLQETLLRKRACAAPGGAALANIVTAACFALCHFAVVPGALSALTALPALAIGWIYQRTRRLAPCVAAHVAMNALWLVTRDFHT